MFEHITRKFIIREGSHALSNPVIETLEEHGWQSISVLEQQGYEMIAVLSSVEVNGNNGLSFAIFKRRIDGDCVDL